MTGVTKRCKQKDWKFRNFQRYHIRPRRIQNIYRGTEREEWGGRERERDRRFPAKILPSFSSQIHPNRPFLPSPFGFFHGDPLCSGGERIRRLGGIQRHSNERQRHRTADPREDPRHERQQRVLLSGPLHLPRQEDRRPYRPLHGRRLRRKWDPSLSFCSICCCWNLRFDFQDFLNSRFLGLIREKSGILKLNFGCGRFFFFRVTWFWASVAICGFLSSDDVLSDPDRWSGGDGAIADVWFLFWLSIWEMFCFVLLCGIIPSWFHTFSNEDCFFCFSLAVIIIEVSSHLLRVLLLW